MILVEPSVLQHKFIFKILCRSIDDYEIVKNKKEFQSNNHNLISKIFNFNLVFYKWNKLESKNILFISSEFQFIFVFVLLRLKGFNIKFIIHEPNLRNSNILFLLRNIINFLLCSLSNQVFSFKKLNFFQSTIINLWSEEKNLKLTANKNILSFGSETQNKRIDLIDIDWGEFKLIRAGKTFHNFKNQIEIKIFIHDQAKDKLFKNCSFSILPYISIQQSMVLIEALSYGHILIINGNNKSWKEFHSLDFIFTFMNSPIEIIPTINKLSSKDIIILRKKSMNFYKSNFSNEETFKKLLS